MSHPVVEHSPDLLRLRNEGYEVAIKEGHLLVSGVPYLNEQGEVKRGILVDPLLENAGQTLPPKKHTMFFTGSHPCHRDGKPMKEIINDDQRPIKLADGIETRCRFSTLANGQNSGDYYEKFTHYIALISAPAQSVDPSATAQTFEPVRSQDEESVFVYDDTNSSRAHIRAVSAKLKGHKIGIVGCGGTGSYILDLVSKTPVAEIHLIDGDEYLQHNAFRAPGAASFDRLAKKSKKVDYWKTEYSKMHRGIVAYAVALDETNLSLLSGLDFVFMSMDPGPAKGAAVKFLEDSKTPFIDVGLGVECNDDSLTASLSVCLSVDGKRDSFHRNVPTADQEEDLYASNIQIADLNMLNAALAVTRWKRHLGFYRDQEGELFSDYNVNFNQLGSHDTPD